MVVVDGGISETSAPGFEALSDIFIYFPSLSNTTMYNDIKAVISLFEACPLHLNFTDFHLSKNATLAYRYRYACSRFVQLGSSLNTEVTQEKLQQQPSESWNSPL